MKGLITILIIAFVGWCFVCTRWYVCDIKGLCSDEQVKGNLVFSKASTNPEVNESTLRLVDSLKSTSRDTLVIIGKYFEDESNGEQLGVKRAENVLDFLRSHEVKDPIRVEIDRVSYPIKNNKYKAVVFEAIINPVVKSTDAFAVKIEGAKMVVNFPKASADPSMSSGLAIAIEELAQKIISEHRDIVVSGHTDNTGDHETNIYYGQVRADAIAQMLVKYGVSQDKITIISKGETEPIASNDTSEGKRKNRRVEIDLNTLK